MSEVRWEDPPPPANKWGTRPWVRILTPLLDHPKRWAIVATYADAKKAITTQRNLRAKAVRMPPGRWEVVARTVGDEHRVYARYLGPDEDGAS